MGCKRMAELRYALLSNTLYLVSYDFTSSSKRYIISIQGYCAVSRKAVITCPRLERRRRHKLV
jgi:hypothetical protein